MDWCDCCDRVFMLAFVNSVVLGGTGFLVYLLITAVRSHSHSTVGIVVVFLVMWVSINGVLYTCVCADFFPWAALANGLLCCVHCIRWLLCLPYRCARAACAKLMWCPYGGGGSSEDVVQSGSHVMNELPGDPTARGGGGGGGSGARISTAADIPAYKQRDAGRQPDGASDCAVCLGEMEKSEMLKRLPACLHMFHQRCVDKWLSGNSTCPVCRCDVFVLLPPEQMV